MWDGVSTPRLRRIVAAISCLGLLWLLTMIPGGPRASAALPSKLWGVELTGDSLARASVATFASMHRQGVTLLLLPSGLSGAARNRVTRLAVRAKLLALEPIPALSDIGRMGGACRAWRGKSGERVCAISASTLRQAAMLLRSHSPGVVVFHFRSPGAFLRSKLPGRGRVVAVVSLDTSGAFERAAWMNAIALAQSRSGTDLVVSQTRSGQSAVQRLPAYLQLLARAFHSRPPDNRMPSGGYPSVFVAPDGRDSGRCSAARPCASFNRAYHVAKPGDVVQIGSGTYPPQTVGVDKSKVHATADVTFRPAPGAIVTIDGDLHMLGSHAVFEGVPGTGDFRLHFLYSDPTDGPDSSNHVSFDFLNGAAFQIGPNVNITIRGGDWGPNLACRGGPALEPSVTPLYTEPGRVPTNIVLEGLRIHDQNSADLTKCHIGGLNVVSADRLIIRNIIFSRDMVYDIEVGDFTRQYGNPRHVVLENNVFGAPVLQDRMTDDGQVELQLAEPGLYKDWLIRFNSFKNGVGLKFDSGGTYSDVRALGNIGESGDCAATGTGVTWAYNVWTARRCGAKDRRVRSLPYVRADPPAEEDFHLRPGTVAGRLVTPNSPDFALATDINGLARPAGHRAAGAYQPAP